MEYMIAAELDIGYIQFESYKNATPNFKKIIPEESYKQTFRTNKQNRWNSRNKNFVSDGMRPWNDGDNWRTSAYVKYSNSTGGKGAIYSNSCDVTGEQDECQTCDMTEQIACYKRKWNEYKTKTAERSIVLEELKNELSVLQSVTPTDYSAQIAAITTTASNTVAKCTSLMGYGGPGMDDVSSKIAATNTGEEWCTSKIDLEGNTCRFNKVQKKPNNKKEKRWKIFCTA